MDDFMRDALAGAIVATGCVVVALGIAALCLTAAMFLDGLTEAWSAVVTIRRRAGVRRRGRLS